MQLQFNFFCRDIERQLAFYRNVLSLPETPHAGSSIYRSLRGPDFEFGFHAGKAFELLGLHDRQPDPGANSVHGYPTFMLRNSDEVDALTLRAIAHGGRAVKRPYATHYGQWQAILADPEGHVFRLACEHLPEGVPVPPRPAA